MSDNADKIQWKGRWQFVENILGLSLTKDPDKLHEEWHFYGKAEYPEFNGHCVCNMSKVKHAHRFYNILTGRVCITGGECAKKLKLRTESKGTNRYLADFLNGSYPSEYTTIEDIYAYSVKQRNDWMKSILKEVDTDLYKKSLKDIRCLLTEFKEFQSILLSNGVCDLTLDGIIRRVEEREKALIQYQEVQAAKRREEEEERKNNAAHNAELYRVALAKHLKEKEEEIERLEEEARENKRKREEAMRECACGIRRENICVCEVPSFEVWKVNKQLACTKCKKWKDRCN
jgi:hypothetical protein